MLCIGGPLDGKLADYHDRNEFQASEPEPFCPWTDVTHEIKPRQSKVTIYARNRIATKDGYVEFWVASNLNFHQALERLIQNYQVPGYAQKYPSVGGPG